MPWNQSSQSGKKTPKVLPRQSLIMKFLSNKIVAVLALACLIVAVLFINLNGSSDKAITEKKAEKKVEKRIKTKQPLKSKVVKEEKEKHISPKEALRAKLKKMTREEREEYAYKQLQERK